MANRVNRMTMCVGAVKTTCILDRDLQDGSKKRYDRTDNDSPTGRVDVKNRMVDQDPEYQDTTSG